MPMMKCASNAAHEPPPDGCDYEPYGAEWIAYMKKLPKAFLVEMLREALIRNKQRQNTTSNALDALAEKVSRRSESEHGQHGERTSGR